MSDISLFRGKPYLVAHKGLVIIGDRVMNLGEANVFLAQLTEVVDQARAYMSVVKQLKPIPVTCKACGHVWLSKSPAGSTTRCKCRQHVVVPEAPDDPQE